MYKLICMTFNGEYITERPEFESIEDAWDYSNNLGSKWFFFPFHFVIKDKTIRDTPDQLRYFNNKRIKTIVKIFNQLSKYPEMEGADIDTFMFTLVDRITELSTIK